MACLLMIAVMPVSAGQTYSGSLAQAGAGWAETNYVETSTGSNGRTYLRVNDIENSGDTVSYFHFDQVGTHASFDSGAPAYASTNFTLWSGTHLLATGTIGYQRNFNTAWPIPAEIEGYQYLLFNSWNITGLSGDGVWLDPEYNHTLVYNMGYGYYGSHDVGSYPSGTGGFNQWMTGPTTAIQAGTHTWNRNYQFENSYTVEQRDDTLLYGAVIKNVGGTIYNSRAMVFRADTGALVASESISSGTQFNFTAYPRNIIIGAKDSRGTTWNSSELVFVSPATTTTPTPTPTPATPGTNTTPIHDIPIPAGYVRTEATCNNGDTGGVINGCDISIYDIQGGAWNNVTGRYDGTWYIDTLPSHTLNMHSYYAGYSEGYEFGVPTSTGTIITTYRLTMWPSTIAAPDDGYLYLKVIVADLDTKEFVEGATVSIRDSTGLTQVDTVPYTGNVEFEVPNSSMVYVSASKNGYVTTSKTYTMSAFGLVQDVVRIEMSKKYVTATQTPVANRTTVDPAGTPDPSGGSSAYSAAKGQNMMDYLAANGMDLVQLCFLVTILGLMGIKLGGK